MVVKIRTDGKILVGGYFGSYNGTPVIRFVRLNSDGSIDSNFSSGSGFSDLPYAIDIQSDGKILVGGLFTSFDSTTQNRITRLNNVPVQTTPPIPPLTTGEEGLIRYNRDISAFQGHNGTKWELLERATTPPTVLDTTGNIDIDFSGSTLRTQGTLTGNIVYTGSEYSAGSSVTIRVTNGSTQRNVAFPSGWKFVGEKPTNIASNKVAILTITSFGSTEADCVAAWAVSE